MPNLLAVTAVTTFALAALTSPLWAEKIEIGTLHIETPMLRETAPNAPVAGGFLTLHNFGEADDRLVSASIADGVAGMVQLHEMVMTDGVMSMSETEGGITIPAGEVVQLAPGGLHIMLMGLTQPLVAGESHVVTLTFEQAGSVDVDFPVLTLGEIRANVSEAGQMDHGNGMQHGTGKQHGQGQGHGN